jgi:transposase InsO family protein
VDHYARAYPVFSYIKGLGRFRHMLRSLRRFASSQVAQERLKIIHFYEKHGETATQEAFGASRKVISRWRRRLVESEGRLESLVPGSTRPQNTRRVLYPAILVEYVRSLRWEHPRLGKEKLKPLVDAYCREHRLKLVSISTIGNIIKRNKLYLYRQGKVYHDPGSGYAQNPKKKKRLRVRYLPKPKDFGHIFSDAVERIVDGKKRYYLNALDAKLKLALSLDYPRLTSANMRDFYYKFQEFYPGKIKDWQTDNGSENLGVFDEALKKDGIPHYFIYPGCPKVNAYIERFNRTFQEEFLDNNLEIVHDPSLFRPALHDWLLFYNTKRVHKSLGNITPLDYWIKRKGMSQMYLTHTYP